MEDHNKVTVVSSLKEMGFEEKLIELAYTRSQIKTIEGVINYIDSHPHLETEPESAPKMDEEKQHQESVGESISAHVNQVLVHELVNAGYTKDVAEKALFFTQNSSADQALGWIEQHKTDPDFLEPLFIVKQQSTGPQLTPEEAKKRAKELQAKIREDRIKKDKQAELEGEILRLKSGKDLTEAQRQIQELQAKLDMERLKKEREEKESAKRKIMEEIEKDRKDRGLKPQSQIKKPIDEVYIEVLKNMHKIYSDPEIIKICISTIIIYLSTFSIILENFIKDPTEEKYRKINAENPNFKARVGEIMGGRNLLKEVGFEENGTFLVIQGTDTTRAAVLVKEIEKTLSRMN